jgi:hypothetical protein
MTAIMVVARLDIDIQKSSLQFSVAKRRSSNRVTELAQRELGRDYIQDDSRCLRTQRQAIVIFIMDAEKRLRRPCKVIPIVCATLVAIAIGLGARGIAYAQLNPAPVVVPGSSSGTSASSVINPSALSIPVAAPSTAAVAVPGAPAALATTSALPVLNPAPVVVSSAALAPAQSVFRCSCFGTGLGVQWIGQVQATSFTSASQAAVGQCAAYVRSTATSSPYINPPGGASFGRSPFPTVNPNLAPGNVVAVPRSPVNTEATSSSIVASQTGYCARCACN